MSLLFRILRATHARGTHHKLALDALDRLQGPDAPAWKRVFLAHAAVYMKGAKAPDDTFKDFKNHVLHPRDDYWGGAPEAVETWYGQTVAALKAGTFGEAAWCAGVMSHYATDPVNPFHTAQSEAENAIHGAAEWSINRAYDELWTTAIARHPALDVATPVGPGWIKALMCAAADRSTTDYERLIAHYDIHRGVVDPPSGLDAVARDLVGELLVYAATLQARLLDRAIAEAGMAPPSVGLTVETVLAALDIPLKTLTNRLADKADRRIIEAMYDELVSTGRVEHTLREDDKTVRALHATEVLAPRQALREAARASRLSAVEAPPVSGGQRAGRDERPVLSRLDVTHRATRDADAEQLSSVPLIPRAAPPPQPLSASYPPQSLSASSPPQSLSASSPPQLSRLETRAGPATASLTAAAALDAAPSIGPKTADRFAALGIRTIGDFLAADADATARALGARHITPGTIAEWQDQARLVLAIPGLRGGHAQLLTGAGFRSVADIAEAIPDDLCARVLAFAATADGHRILREGHAPDLARIKGWIDDAANARAA